MFSWFNCPECFKCYSKGNSSSTQVHYYYDRHFELPPHPLHPPLVGHSVRHGHHVSDTVLGYTRGHHYQDSFLHYSPGKTKQGCIFAINTSLSLSLSLSLSV